MKRRAAIIIVAVMLVVLLASVGFAAGYGQNRRAGNQGICAGYCLNLNPEEQAQIRTAREECREEMDGLREEFRSRQQSLRKECLEKLPEAVREQVQEKMAAHDGQGCGRMHGQHGCGAGLGLGRQK